jgi:hypothetical protein
MNLDRLHCDDCHERLRYVYMIKQSLWESLGLKRTNNFCIPCLRSRLGRDFNSQDFIVAPCNWIIEQECKEVHGYFPGVLYSDVLF